MNVLLDTHILLWTLTQSDKLSPKAVAIIDNPDNDAYASVASFWEIALKHAKRPQDMRLSGKQVIQMARKAGIATLDIKKAHVESLETLNQREGSSHKDPFDRMLIAQAKGEGMAFLTHDAKMTEYDESCIVLC